VSTAIEPQLLIFKNWIFRLLLNNEQPGKLLILLHGWMGDENSMWVFTSGLSSKYTILAPRAPFSVAEGGYSWREIQPGTWGKASLEELGPSVQVLISFVNDWSTSAGMDARQFDLMGFSQGAALAYSLTLLYPERVRRLMALSGFIPEHAKANLANQLSGKMIFVAHGRHDEMVPVEQARKAVAMLNASGAQVTYCESDASHKVSKECMKELDIFLRWD
jgi:phospholipase/carboxylesterase